MEHLKGLSAHMIPLFCTMRTGISACEDQPYDVSERILFASVWTARDDEATVVRITHLTGSTVLTMPEDALEGQNRVMLSMEDQPAGVYPVQTATGVEVRTVKWVKVD